LVPKATSRLGARCRRPAGCAWIYRGSNQWYGNRKNKKRMQEYTIDVFVARPPIQSPRLVVNGPTFGSSLLSPALSHSLSLLTLTSPLIYAMSPRSSPAKPTLPCCCGVTLLLFYPSFVFHLSSPVLLSRCVQTDIILVYQDWTAWRTTSALVCLRGAFVVFLRGSSSLPI